MKTLKSIFDFYSRQHLMIGRNATFDKIEERMQKMNMGEYLRFIKDFKKPFESQDEELPFEYMKQKGMQAFKQVAEYRTEIDFFQFKASLYILFSFEDALITESIN